MQVENVAGRFVEFIARSDEDRLTDPANCPELLMDEVFHSNRRLCLTYAPFDYINDRARLIIVGLTRGNRRLSKLFP